MTLWQNSLRKLLSLKKKSIFNPGPSPPQTNRCTLGTYDLKKKKNKKRMGCKGERRGREIYGAEERNKEQMNE